MLRKKISDLQETLEERTREANHMLDLVEKMEAAGGQEDMRKVQVDDLKQELANAEGTKENTFEKTRFLIIWFAATIKSRTDEILSLRRDLKTRDEEVQQREIDISCLRGQVRSKCEVHLSSSLRRGKLGVGFLRCPM